MSSQPTPAAFFSRGHVFHSRLGKQKNAFRYPVFTFLFPCHAEKAVQADLRRQSHGLIALRARDFLIKKSDSFDQGIRSFLQEHAGYEPEEVWLQSFPRMFGYAFNPVSFWFCKRDGVLEAVLVEVNNTFGERHFYWVHPGRPILQGEVLRAEKVFHVSPFYPVEGYYEFNFQLGEKSSRVDINYYSNEGVLLLLTWVEGVFTPLAEQKLLPLIRSYGWMTPLVVFRIHWQALRLWIKKVPFISKPPPPLKKVS